MRLFLTFPKPYVMAILCIIMRNGMTVWAYQLNIFKRIIKSISVYMMYLQNLWTNTPPTNLAFSDGGPKIFRCRFVTEPMAVFFSIWVVWPSSKIFPIWMGGHCYKRVLRMSFPKKWIAFSTHICNAAFLRTVSGYCPFFCSIGNPRYGDIKRSGTRFANKRFSCSFSANREAGFLVCHE